MIRGMTLVLLLVLFTAPAIAAPIYKTKDARGNVVYTDDPAGQPAELVELPNLTIVPGTPITGPTPGSASTEEEKMPPLRLELLAPEQEATVRSNTGDVEVVARVNRSPADGDRFEVLIDGAVRGSNAGGTFALSGIDRGAHQVRVRLVDPAGKIVAQSPEHTFYLHQRSRLGP
jgi:hypothetical protein